MPSYSETQTIVWHDLLTPDVESAKRFYADLLGWKYEVEHATDFAWSSGEADYPLIVVDEVAHGGFVEIDSGDKPQWLAFVAVDDVDSVTERALHLDATVLKPAFDVPGVGRTSVIEDPGGATICPFRRTHEFPAPRGTFVWDELISDNVERAVSFYHDLFGWTSVEGGNSIAGSDIVFKNSNDAPVAGLRLRPQAADESDHWLPYMAAGNRSDAPLVDPTGAAFRTLRVE